MKKIKSQQNEALRRALEKVKHSEITKKQKQQLELSDFEKARLYDKMMKYYKFIVFILQTIYSYIDLGLDVAFTIFIYQIAYSDTKKMDEEGLANQYVYMNGFYLLLFCLFLERKTSLDMIIQVYKNGDVTQTDRLSYSQCIKIFFIVLFNLDHWYLYDDKFYEFKRDKEQAFLKKQMITMYCENIPFLLVKYISIFHQNFICSQTQGNTLTLISILVSYISVLMTTFKMQDERIQIQQILKTKQEQDFNDYPSEYQAYIVNPFILGFFKQLSYEMNNYPQFYKPKIVNKTHKEQQELLRDKQKIEKNLQMSLSPMQNKMNGVGVLQLNSSLNPLQKSNLSAFKTPKPINSNFQKAINKIDENNSNSDLDSFSEYDQESKRNSITNNNCNKNNDNINNIFNKKKTNSQFSNQNNLNILQKSTYDDNIIQQQQQQYLQPSLQSNLANKSGNSTFLNKFSFGGTMNSELLNPLWNNVYFQKFCLIMVTLINCHIFFSIFALSQISVTKMQVLNMLILSYILYMPQIVYYLILEYGRNDEQTVKCVNYSKTIIGFPFLAIYGLVTFFFPVDMNRLPFSKKMQENWLINFLPMSYTLTVKQFVIFVQTIISSIILFFGDEMLMNKDIINIGNWKKNLMQGEGVQIYLIIFWIFYIMYCSYQIAFVVEYIYKYIQNKKLKKQKEIQEKEKEKEKNIRESQESEYNGSPPLSQDYSKANQIIVINQNSPSVYGKQKSNESLSKSQKLSQNKLSKYSNKYNEKSEENKNNLNNNNNTINKSSINNSKAQLQEIDGQLFTPLKIDVIDQYNEINLNQYKKPIQDLQKQLSNEYQSRKKDFILELKEKHMKHVCDINEIECIEDPAVKHIPSTYNPKSPQIKYEDDEQQIQNNKIKKFSQDNKQKNNCSNKNNENQKQQQQYHIKSRETFYTHKGITELIIHEQPEEDELQKSAQCIDNLQEISENFSDDSSNFENSQKKYSDINQSQTQKIKSSTKIKSTQNQKENIDNNIIVKKSNQNINNVVVKQNQNAALKNLVDKQNTQSTLEKTATGDMFSNKTNTGNIND